MSVTIGIASGPTYEVEYVDGMTALTAMQEANANGLTYTIEYYSGVPGYLVDMINGTWETFASSDHPFFYWQFDVNGSAQPTGVDSTVLNDGDTVTFSLEAYDSGTHEGTLLAVKHARRAAAVGS